MGRIIQRLLALNACVWRNWIIGASIKRPLIAHDHRPAQIPPVNDLDVKGAVP
jgi:hypothetical protein